MKTYRTRAVAPERTVDVGELTPEGLRLALEHLTGFELVAELGPQKVTPRLLDAIEPTPPPPA